MGQTYLGHLVDLGCTTHHNFSLGVLYAAYLLLWSLTDDEHQRAKVCSIVGILIFCDIPIIYKSVSWWRTLHQPPSLMGNSGTTMSSSIFNALLLSIVLTFLFSLWLIYTRAVNIKLEDQIQKRSNRSYLGPKVCKSEKLSFQSTHSTHCLTLCYLRNCDFIFNEQLKDESEEKTISLSKSNRTCF